MIERRRFGEGTIERSGRGHRVRMRAGGKRPDLGTYATVEEADRIRKGFLLAQASGAIETGALTLRVYGERWLDRREKKGTRGIVTDRSRWREHIESSLFIDRPIGSIERRDVKRWLGDLEIKSSAGGKPLSWQTRKHCLNLLRRAFRDAVDDELIVASPCRDIEYERPADSEAEAWAYLTPDEQARLLRTHVSDRADVLLVAVAIGAGLRQGEQWNLELRDVHADEADPWLYVRWGSKGKPPKNGRPRRVPLFGLALDAVREWLAALPTYAKANPHGLAFPTARGARRGLSKTPPSWPAMLRAAKLLPEQRAGGRGVRWHDLRHTCASSLVAGWWGRSWTLQEVRDLLGHRSIITTERYAHLAPGVIGAAGAATVGPNLAREVTDTDRSKELENKGRVTRDSNARPSASEADRATYDLMMLAVLRANVRATSERVVRSVAQRNRFARGHAVEAADAALELCDALDAFERREPTIVETYGEAVSA